MAILNIVKFPDPSLRIKAKQVTKFDASFQDLVQNMFETLRDAPGVGLAGPQVGESLRVVVVEYNEDEDENAKPKQFVLVNPEIIETSAETVTDVEGCLSLPGLAGEVERFEAVTVRAQNKFGKKIKVRVDGWLARIFQHEIDHLNGILYIDKAEKVFQPSEAEAEDILD